MIKQTFVILLVVLLGGVVGAQGLFEEALGGGTEEEKGVEKGGTGVGGGIGMEVDGYVRGTLYMGKVSGKDRTEVKAGFGEVGTAGRVRMGDWGDGRCELRFHHGYDGEQVQGGYDVREAYVDLYLGPVDVRFGHQILVWGRADAFNPTDNLTPRDMRVRSPDEDDRRLANLALRTTFNFEPVRWEWIYVPFYAPSFFPIFAMSGPIGFDEADYPEPLFENATAATRLNVELPAVDFSLSYLYGYATFPGVGLANFSVAGIPPEVSVQFRAYQHHVVGFDFATAVGEWFGLRGEAALRWPLDEGRGEHVPLREIQYVTGIDREFGDLSIILQYVGKTVLDWEPLPATGLMELAAGKQPSPEQLAAILADPEGAALSEVARKTRMVSGQTEEISHSVSLRLAWKLVQETLLPEILGLYNVSTGEWLIQPKLTYLLADGLHVVAGVEIYGGPDDTLFGTIDATMSAGFLEFKAHF